MSDLPKYISPRMRVHEYNEEECKKEGCVPYVPPDIDKTINDGLNTAYNRAIDDAIEVIKDVSAGFQMLYMISKLKSLKK